MALEQILERIAVALETIATGQSGAVTPAEPAKKPAKKAPAAAPAADPTPATEAAPAPKGPTTADVQAAVVAAISKNVRNAAVNILNAVGAKKASEVKAADIPTVLANLQALIAEADLVE